ncbi:3-methyl-2-oxobutanoate hydroxymethyltransferase [Hydrogenimonas sp.]
MRKKETITSLKAAKGERKLVMLTAYDALFASLFRESADMLLVGDSLNMSFLGEPDTLSATLDQMIYHTRAVCNGAPESFVVCDMPFGTTNTPGQALENAVKVFQQTRADAIKIEGGQERSALIEHLTDNAIAVMGHVGLMPQSVRSEGGYKVQGRDEKSFQKTLDDAVAVEEAGAFALVVEGVVPDLAAKITETVSIPVIGIGAGRQTDGQVLVWSDMLGLFEAFTPKFVKKYMNGAEAIKEAVAQYAQEVRNGAFPGEEHCYK